MQLKTKREMFYFLKKKKGLTLKGARDKKGLLICTTFHLYPCVTFCSLFAYEDSNKIVINIYEYLSLPPNVVCDLI